MKQTARLTAMVARYAAVKLVQQQVAAWILEILAAYKVPCLLITMAAIAL